MKNNIHFNGLNAMVQNIQKRILRWRLERLTKKKLEGLELLPHLIKLLNPKLIRDYTPGIATNTPLNSRRTNLETLLKHTDIIITSIKETAYLPKETQYDNSRTNSTNLEQFLTTDGGIELEIDEAITLTKNRCASLIKSMNDAARVTEERHSYYVRKASNVTDDLLEVCVAYIKLQL